MLDVQKVLQFQSRGTLMAISGRAFGVGPPFMLTGIAKIGLLGAVFGLWPWMTEDSSLEAWLLVRLRQALKPEKQWRQARLVVPRGL